MCTCVFRHTLFSVSCVCRSIRQFAAIMTVTRSYRGKRLAFLRYNVAQWYRRILTNTVIFPYGLGGYRDAVKKSQAAKMLVCKWYSMCRGSYIEDCGLLFSTKKEIYRHRYTYFSRNTRFDALEIFWVRFLICPFRDQQDGWDGGALEEIKAVEPKIRTSEEWFWLDPVVESGSVA